MHLTGVGVPLQNTAAVAANPIPPTFRLLRYFSVASFLAIILATLVLTALHQTLAVDGLVRAQEHHHAVLTQSVARGHWHEFSHVFDESAGLSAAQLRAHAETRRLRELMGTEFAGTPVVKVKIYDLRGRTVFSSDPAQIGEDKSRNSGFLSARDGVVASELTHRNQFSAFEQTIENVDIVSSYVPVQLTGDGGRIRAVFEIYSDISPLLRLVQDTRHGVALRVSAVLLMLFVVLHMIVRRADGIIQGEAARRRENEAKLEAARAALSRSEEFHRALIEQSSDAVLVLDGDCKVVYSTPTDARVLGVGEQGLAGSRFADYVCEEQRETVQFWLRRLQAQAGGIERIEFEANHGVLGRRHFVAVGSNLIQHAAVGGMVLNIRDVTKRRIAEQQVRRSALYDELTGLARREHFVHQVRKALAYAARHHEGLAVLFLDLDGFKRINDTRGHHAGDQILKQVAVRLRGAVREEDDIGANAVPEEGSIARLGGDEFTILLSAVSNPGGAAVAAQRVITAVAAPYELDGAAESVTASVGIALYPDDARDVETLLKLADAAMYRAKQQGKNTYCYYNAQAHRGAAEAARTAV